jgi:hypothetical protein
MSKETDDADEAALTKMMRDVLATCSGKGMVLPFTLVTVAVNGSLFALRTDGETTEQLADHTVDNIFMSPVNVMIVDARGEAVRVVFDKSGAPGTYH